MINYWKGKYLRYSEIENLYINPEDLDDKTIVHRRTQVLRHSIFGVRTLEDILSENITLQTTIPVNILEELISFRRDVDYTMGIGVDHIPRKEFDNVFHAAFYMKITTDNRWNKNPGIFDPGDNYIFRGSKNEKYKFTATIFREERNPEDLEKLAILLGKIKQMNPAYSFEELLAIVTHYSSELGTYTWFLDYSFDPFISLFFASNNADEGTTGVVISQSRSEWDNLLDSSIAGEIKVIIPEELQRIRSQKGLFIDRAHNEIIEQLVPFSVFFNQIPKLTFEDEKMGITKNKLFPQELLDAIINTPDPEPLYLDKIISTVDGYPKKLDTDHYFAIAISIAARSDKKSITNEEVILLLKKICDFHVRTQTLKGDVSSRSIHNLILAVKMAIHRSIENNNKQSGFDLMLSQYFFKSDGSMNYQYAQLIKEIFGREVSQKLVNYKVNRKKRTD